MLQSNNIDISEEQFIENIAALSWIEKHG